jgi:hypothetical protein
MEMLAQFVGRGEAYVDMDIGQIVIASGSTSGSLTPGEEQLPMEGGEGYVDIGVGPITMEAPVAVPDTPREGAVFAKTDGYNEIPDRIAELEAQLQAAQEQITSLQEALSAGSDERH